MRSNNFSQTFTIDSFSFGNSQNDWISFYFSEEKGYPEIYQVNLDKLTKFPFSIEPEYRNNPDLFEVLDIDGDGLTEILMKIQSENNRIPKQWTKQFGFKTNFIVIELENEKLRVRDQTNAEINRRKLCQK